LGCTYALHFTNGPREFLIRPEDPQAPIFRGVEAQFPNTDVLDGLSQEHTADLLSKYSDVVMFDIAAQAFTLPHVPLGVAVDLTPGPNPTPLPDDLRAMLSGGSQSGFRP
jgi:hypothetical protein